MRKIKVYDISAFIQKEVEDGEEFEAFQYKKAAIFEGSRGVVLAEAEAVHVRENLLTDSVLIPVCPIAEEGHMYVTATHDLVVPLSDIVENAPYEEMYIEEFFSRRNYNPRCEDNYTALMGSLRDIGFDLQGYFEEKTESINPLFEKQVSDAAERAESRAHFNQKEHNNWTMDRKIENGERI